MFKSNQRGSGPYRLPRDVMQKEEFLRLAMSLYGDCWQTKTANILGVHRGTIWRYANGKGNIPGPVARAMKLLYDEKINQMRFH